MSVLMDANALMMPVECGVRVFEELDRVLGTADAGDRPSGLDTVVPRAVLDELDRLADGAGEAATAASVGIDLARDRCRVLDHDAESGDAAVLECAGREDVTHAVTNDGALRERLLDAGVPVISLRARNKLAVTRP
ncbi:MAG: PIN domain-containing protein [Haloarculaceae archaeon]